jgi:hypothetical protein
MTATVVTTPAISKVLFALGGGIFRCTFWIEPGVMIALRLMSSPLYIAVICALPARSFLSVVGHFRRTYVSGSLGVALGMWETLNDIGSAQDTFKVPYTFGMSFEIFFLARFFRLESRTIDWYP